MQDDRTSLYGGGRDLNGLSSTDLSCVSCDGLLAVCERRMVRRTMCRKQNSHGYGDFRVGLPRRTNNYGREDYALYRVSLAADCWWECTYDNRR